MPKMSEYEKINHSSSILSPHLISQYKLTFSVQLFKYNVSVTSEAPNTLKPHCGKTFALLNERMYT